MEDIDEKLVSPMTRTGSAFLPFVASLLAVTAWAAFAWWNQLSHGFQVTGLSDTVVWGLYISNFVFLIGISHAGILISATVRIMNLEKYRPVARMSEALTLVGLVMAVLSVIIDLGRPDRWYVFLLSLRITSPLAWDFVFIALYFTLSALYLLLSLRDDIIRCEGVVNKRMRWLYRLLIWVYDRVTPRDHEKHEKLLNRFALIVVPFPVFGSGMVVPFIFSFLVAKPSWNVPFFGPYFLSAAILSGVSVVVLLAAVLRRVFQWEDYLKPELFRGLGNVLAVLIPVYVYFTFVEQFTSQYVGATVELAISNYLLRGPFAVPFWSMLILGFFVPFFILIASRKNSLKWIYLASLLVSVGLWIKRVIIVVPTLIHPNLPYDIGVYVPTWVEWSIIAGTFTLGMLLYTIFVKLFPIIELDVSA